MRKIFKPYFEVDIGWCTAHLFNQVVCFLQSPVLQPPVRFHFIAIFRAEGPRCSLVQINRNRFENSPITIGLLERSKWFVQPLSSEVLMVFILL
ncbi:hypothetical protein SAMN05421740_104241 [Parapedobacter koreensis]|uniref:Uncharacterized protein n=1 Tax=Parapedobacter koreensis TaxID=332977 RepID=A0A1H7P784_9SPHI|nr:hypothetical protein SAMN05421740_104241 [Parapedobacter koreensis]